MQVQYRSLLWRGLYIYLSTKMDRYIHHLQQLTPAAIRSFTIEQAYGNLGFSLHLPPEGLYICRQQIALLKERIYYLEKEQLARKEQVAKRMDSLRRALKNTEKHLISSQKSEPQKSQKTQQKQSFEWGSSVFQYVASLLKSNNSNPQYKKPSGNQLKLDQERQSLLFTEDQQENNGRTEKKKKLL